MSTVRILHTADLHLDTPFRSLSSEKAAVRREELRELPGRIARTAIIEKVDMLLLAGDILDSESFFRETGEELFRVLRNLPLPVFIAPGNHDYYFPGSPYARVDLPSNVYVFAKNTPEYFDFSEKGFRVYGASFTDKTSASLTEKLHADRKENILNILCVHGEVVSGKDRMETGRYNPMTAEQIAASGMDYIALGHIHKASGLLQSGNVWYSWPGCPEGRGFDETGEKTVNIIALSNDGLRPDEMPKCEMHTVPASSRRYETLKVNITDKDPLLAVQMELPDDTISDIYKIILCGETDSPIQVRKLQESLSEYFFELSVSDETDLSRDIWERAGDDSLRGMFLAKMRAQYDAASDGTDRLQIEQAVRWGLAALDNREEVVRHEDP